MRFKWYRKLYVGEMAAKSKYKVFAKVRQSRFSFDTYLITLPSNHENLLDIVSANTFKQPHYKKDNSKLFVVGIADGKDEAYEVARQIIDDVYSDTGALDVEGYVLGRQ